MGMKKILFTLLLLCISCGLMGAEWGPMYDYVNSAPDSSVGEKYLLKKILRGQEIKIALAIEDETTGKRKEIERLIENSYNAWFKVAVKEIRKHNREREFADIMPVLKKEVKISFVNIPYSAEDSLSENPSSYDVTVFFLATGDHMRQIWGSDNVAALYNNLLRIMWLCATEVRKGDSFERMVIHEIGHSLGFADRYQYTYNHDESYGSERTRDSVMNEAQNVTCDDADGMINLIDLTNGTIRGGEKGWKSLCSSTEWYVKGKTVFRGDYKFFSEENQKYWILENNESAEQKVEVYPLAQNGLFPSDPAKNKVLRQSKDGRILLAQGSRGELIYHAYFYNEVAKMAVLNNEVVYVQRDTVDGYARARWLTMGTNGNVIFFKGVLADTAKNTVLQKDYHRLYDTIYNEEKFVHQKVFKTQIGFLNGKKEVKSWEEKKNIKIEDPSLSDPIHRASMAAQNTQWCHGFVADNPKNNVALCTLFIL